MSHIAVLIRGSLAIATACALTGCYAEATTGADVEYAPPVANVEVYPHEYYDGRVVYLVNDRWYYREGPRWVYYQSEPPVLYRRRTVVRSQPAVIRERAEVHRAPPARQYAPPPRTAPPAHVERVAPPAHVERTAPPAHVERREYRVE